MHERNGNRCRPIVAAVTGLVSSIVLFPAEAKDFDIELDSSGIAMAAVEQPAPQFPNGRMRGGQEGWVRLSFVIDADGRAVDPLVLDSSGGPLFEQAALDAATRWRFEAPAAAAEHGLNTVDVRFEISGDRDRASRGFLRRDRNIVTDLYYLKPDAAREKVDMANDFGGWNLYEATMLAFLNARVEGAEDHRAEELEYYRRALAVSRSETFVSKNRIEILGRIFGLEVDAGQYGDALATLAELRAEKGSDEALAGLADRIRQLEDSIGDDAAIVAAGTIYNPCDCDEGVPLWAHTPVRRNFSFADVDGNVQRFEARCENHRFSAQVTTGTRWSLPDEWGSCRIFVFGDDAATFGFVEHREEPGDEGVGGSAVASSDVVDKPDRSQ